MFVLRVACSLHNIYKSEPACVPVSSAFGVLIILRLTGKHPTHCAVSLGKWENWWNMRSQGPQTIFVNSRHWPADCCGILAKSNASRILQLEPWSTAGIGLFLSFSPGRAAIVFQLDVLAEWPLTDDLSSSWNRTRNRPLYHTTVSARSSPGILLK
jgi:hypothetical protein